MNLEGIYGLRQSSKKGDLTLYLFQGSHRNEGKHDGACPKIVEALSPFSFPQLTDSFNGAPLRLPSSTRGCGHPGNDLRGEGAEVF